MSDETAKESEKNSLNVLSIDFDVFQNVTADALKACYPDGHDMSTNMSRIVWSGYYANPNTHDMLDGVTINQPLLDEFINGVKKCRNNIPVLVANSHVNIYDFIRNNMYARNITKLNLINADLHHDMCNDNYTMDCGNWIKYVAQDYDAKITWIANPVSPDIFGLDEKITNHMKFDFSDVDFEKIDLLFMCRSDPWFPPHLDKYFDRVVKILCIKFTDISGEKGITTPREMTDLVGNQKAIIDRMRSGKTDD